MLQDWTGVSTFDPKEAETFSDDPLFVRAAARAVAVLSAFEHAYKPLSLNEISALSGVDRSAAQRMVHTLQALDLITRDDEDRGYLPGKRILTMAYSYLRLNPVAQKATPVLLELRRRTRERVDMSFWDDTRLIYALRMPSKHEIFTATLIGNAVPVYCTAGGLAVLSCLPDAEIADIFERSPRMSYTTETFTTLAEVMEAVEAARTRGHSIVSGQLLRHELAMGVPVRDGQGRPLGAIHLAGSLEEHSVEEFSAKFGSLLEQAGRTVSGFR
ncbi:MAG: IclR family transcriptional regulator [Paracoccus sp. (in: a-proteobacteria)]